MTRSLRLSSPLRAAAILLAAALALTALVVAAPDAPAAQAAGACTSTPFSSSAKAKKWYRIPAIVKTNSGALVAFAERRDNDKDTDMGDFDIVMRVSTNGGCSWGGMKVVANDGSERVSNPVPVYDAATDTVFLFTSVRAVKKNTYKGLYVQRIVGDGASWTPLNSGKISINTIDPVTNKMVHGSWKGGLTGPGHGIVLTQGANAGRIIFAMGYKKGGTYGTYGIYSDDDGATWRIGFDRAAPAGIKLIEGTIAERADGVLVVSYRNLTKTKPGANRFIAYSYDSGASLTSYKRAKGVATMAVQGSLLQTAGAKSVLLLSGPAFVKTKDLSIRKGMAIFLSTTGGATWKRGANVGGTKVPAAYSDLVQVNESTVGILYETGKKGWRDKIVFAQVPLSKIR